MPRSPDRRNQLEYLRSMREDLRTKTNLNNFDRDSKIRALIDVFTTEQIAIRESAINSFNSQQISRAIGEQLDRIGDQEGLRRLEPTFAFASAASQTFRFFVESGTFGSINGGADILVPRGTELFSLPNQNEANSVIKFITTEDTLLPAAASSGAASARAEISGANHNIGQLVIKNHNFQDYTGYASSTLKVTNFFPILNGRNRESDDQYRYRLSQNDVRRRQANDIMMQLSSVEVPGVRQVKVIPAYFGVGTCGLIVLGPDNQATQSLVGAVQAKINQIKTPALTVVATPATEVLFDFELEVKTKLPLSDIEKINKLNEMRTAANEYMRGIDLGGTVDLDELALTMQRAVSGAIQMGSSGDLTAIFKKVYVSRSFASAGSSNRETLIATTYVMDDVEFADIRGLTVTWMN